MRRVLTLLAIVSLGLAGCGGSSPSPKSHGQVAEYTVRGRITALPDPARPASQLVVHHEPIPSFMSGGEVVGMDEMQMPFPTIAHGVSLEGLEIGTAVSMVFEVEYDPETKTPMTIRVLRIQALSPDTKLTIDAPASDPSD